MFAYRSNPFVYWWSVTNPLVNDLNRTRQRNRKNCVCGGGEDGRQNGVDGIVDGERLKMR